MKTIKTIILKSLLESHEEYYNTDGRSGSLIVDLNGFTFFNQILSGFNFSGISLKDSKFINCELVGSHFVGSNLENVDFTASRLTFSTFKDAYLQNTNFTDSKIGGAIFDDTDLRNSIFKNTRFKENISKNRNHKKIVYAKVSDVKYSNAQFISEEFIKYIKSKNTDMIAEISEGVKSFNIDFKDKKTAFIIMQFSETPAHDKIVKTIKETLIKNNIVGLRADDKQYCDGLFDNIKTYMHCCDFGISVFERILQDDFNPNVSIEVGYMLGLRKNICLLKDQTLKSLPTDLLGKLYKQFDPQNIEGTLPAQLNKWLQDKGII